MADNYFKIKKGVNVEPAATSVDTKGDIAYNSATEQVEVFTTAKESITTDSNTQALTNKTLSGNTAATLVNGSGTLALNSSGTVTVPNATDTLVGKATTDTLTNKTITGNTAVNLVSGSGTMVLNTSGTVTLPNATDTLVGKDTTDTLTNKSISGASNTLTNIPNSATTATDANTNSAIVARDASGNFSAGVITASLTGNVTGNVSGTAANVTGTVAIANGGTGQTGATAAFDALAPTTTKGDVIVHNGSDNIRVAVGSFGQALVADNSAAAGVKWSTIPQGVKNYITTNAGIEQNSTTGYSLGNVALTSNFPSGVPTFGSGASADLGITVISSGQLAGSYSLQYASSVASTAGNFLATDAFTIDKEDQAKVLSFKFYYEAASGASNCNFSGTSSNSFGVAIYDVTNSAWIQPAGVYNLVQSSGVGICTGTFQTASNAASLRLVLFNANASSGTFGLYLDDFFCGPDDLASLTQAPTPAVVAFNGWNPSDLVGTNTNASTATVSTLGNSGVTFTTNGTGTTITTTTALTAGTVQANFSKIGWYEVTVTGLGQYSNSNTYAELPTTYGGTATNYAANSIFYPFIHGTGTVNGTGTETFLVNVTATGQTLTVRPQFRVSGGGSTPQRTASMKVTIRQVGDTGAASDGRVVAASYNGTVGVSGNDSTYYYMDFPTKLVDTHSGASNITGVSTSSASAWKYTIPVSGIYRISATLSFGPSSTSYRLLSVMKNATTQYFLCQQPGFAENTTSECLTGTVTLQLVAGDYIQIQGWQGTGSSLQIGGGLSDKVSIERLSGPATIAATESVYAEYTTNTATAFAASTDTTIPFEDKTNDSHGAYNTATGTYTIPVTGTYQISSAIMSSVISWTSGNQFQLGVFKNGSLYRRISCMVMPATANYRAAVSGSATVRLNAGDTIKISVWSHGAGSVEATTETNWFSISRVG